MINTCCPRRRPVSHRAEVRPLQYFQHRLPAHSTRLHSLAVVVGIRCRPISIDTNPLAVADTHSIATGCCCSLPMQSIIAIRFQFS
jgi:hypothetical protein